jgi:hypothetical protein
VAVVVGIVLAASAQTGAGQALLCDGAADLICETAAVTRHLLCGVFMRLMGGGGGSNRPFPTVFDPAVRQPGRRAAGEHGQKI